MKRSIKQLFAAAIVAAVSCQTLTTASACGGSGGARYARPAFASPYYRGPASVYPRSAASHVPSYAQAPYQQQIFPKSVVTARQNVTRLSQQLPAAQQPFGQSLAAPAAARPAANQAAVAQPAATQPAARPAAIQPAVSQGAVPQSAVSQRAVSQPAATQPAQTSALAALAAIGSTNASTVPASTTTAPARVAPVNTTVPAAATTVSHVGTWQAQLPNQVTVQLQLNDGGTFSWIVRNQGKTTEFGGLYRIQDGQLTLVRNKDLQKMSGTWKAAGEGFAFQLSGNNSAALNFRKS